MPRRAALRLAALFAVAGFAVASAHADSSKGNHPEAVPPTPLQICPSGSALLTLIDRVKHGSVYYHAFPQAPGNDQWGHSSSRKVTFCLANSAGMWTVDAQTASGHIMTATTVHANHPAQRLLLGHDGDRQWFFAPSQG